MGLACARVPRFFPETPTGKRPGMCFEAGEIVGIRRQAAAGGNDGFFSRDEFADDFFFRASRNAGSPSLGENFTDGFAGARFDDVIGVEKSEVQLRGDQLADGGFARSHETDERNILNLAHGAHRIELTDLSGD